MNIENAPLLRFLFPSLLNELGFLQCSTDYVRAFTSRPAPFKRNDDFSDCCWTIVSQPANWQSAWMRFWHRRSSVQRRRIFSGGWQWFTDVNMQ